MKKVCDKPYWPWGTLYTLWTANHFMNRQILSKFVKKFKRLLSNFISIPDQIKSGFITNKSSGIIWSMYCCPIKFNDVHISIYKITYISKETQPIRRLITNQSKVYRFWCIKQVSTTSACLLERLAHVLKYSINVN